MTTRVQGLAASWKQHIPGGTQELDWKNSVKAATVVALPANTLDGVTNTLTADANGAFPAIDGVGIAEGESILVKNEGGGTSPSNGIFILTDAGSAGTPWVLTRRDDADTDAKVTAGMAVPVAEGTQADTAWLLATNDPISLNTTPLTFVKFSANPLCNALPVAIVAGAVGAAGISGEVSRCDHEHAVAVASPVEISDTTNAPGVAGTLIRSDHVHAHGDRGGGSLHALVTIATAGFMSAADKVKLDGIQPGAAAVCGSAPTAISAGSAGAVGTDIDAARCDHEHAVPVASPVATGTANAPGASTSLVRADHVHETAVVIQDEGVPGGTAHTVNYVGAGVTAAVAAGVATVTIPGGGSVADALGGMACNNAATNIATVIPAVGTFVPVGTGNPGTHPLYIADATLNDFAVAGATADVQTLDYAGAAARDVIITPTVVLSTGVLGGIIAHMRVLQNGVQVGPTLVGQTAGLFFSTGAISGEIHTNAAPGDTFQIEVANLTNGTNVIVDFAQLSIEGQGA